VLVTIHLVSGTGPSLYFFNCDSVAGANDLEGPSSFVIALRHCRYRCYICAIADTDVTFAPLPIPMLHLRHCRYRCYICAIADTDVTSILRGLLQILCKILAVLVIKALT